MYRGHAPENQFWKEQINSHTAVKDSLAAPAI